MKIYEDELNTSEENELLRTYLSKSTKEFIPETSLLQDKNINKILRYILPLICIGTMSIFTYD
jgi:hypothetical protein